MTLPIRPPAPLLRAHATHKARGYLGRLLDEVATGILASPSLLEPITAELARMGWLDEGPAGDLLLQEVPPLEGMTAPTPRTYRIRGAGAVQTGDGQTPGDEVVSMVRVDRGPAMGWYATWIGQDGQTCSVRAPDVTAGQVAWPERVLVGDGRAWVWRYAAAVAVRPSEEPLPLEETPAPTPRDRARRRLRAAIQVKQARQKGTAELWVGLTVGNGTGGPYTGDAAPELWRDDTGPEPRYQVRWKGLDGWEHVSRGDVLSRWPVEVVRTTTGTWTALAWVPLGEDAPSIAPAAPMPDGVRVERR